MYDFIILQLFLFQNASFAKYIAEAIIIWLIRLAFRIDEKNLQILIKNGGKKQKRSVDTC